MKPYVPLRRDQDSLGDDQSSACTLRVVLEVQRVRHVGWDGTAARESGEEDAVLQGDRTESERLEEGRERWIWRHGVERMELGVLQVSGPQS